MIRRIVTSRVFLSRPSIKATPYDKPIGEDLMDTFAAHRPGCVGMAANMIGERKRIIAVVDDDGSILVMLNPRLIHESGTYDTEEGCLSLEGMRPAHRFERITVGYEDELLRSCTVERTGRVAQAIQHEIDHCNGVII